MECEEIQKIINNTGTTTTLSSSLFWIFWFYDADALYIGIIVFIEICCYCVLKDMMEYKEIEMSIAPKSNCIFKYNIINIIINPIHCMKSENDERIGIYIDIIEDYM